MSEKELQELKEMERNLYDLLNKTNSIDTKLGDAWSMLYNYLRELGIYPDNT